MGNQRENAANFRSHRENSVWIYFNGMPDHIHCLFLLSPQKSIADAIKQIKGSSSHYINQNNLIVEKFAWQTGYAAYSVSQSVVDKVFHYINNQKKHHQKKTFAQEHDEFLKLYGLNESKWAL